MDTVNSLLDRIFDWVITVIPKVIAAIVIFLVMFYLAGLVARWIRRTGERRGLNPEVTLLLTRLGSWGMITLGVIWALQQVNFNLTAFLAGLGIIGFTVGFALQDISRNFVAGLLLLWQQPFGIGDLIQVTGYTGRVTDVSLRATEIRTSDGLLVLIPNADVYTKPITNYTQAPRRRLAIKAWAPYGEDLERATAIALEAIGQAPILALADPAPSVVFDSFGDSSVAFTLYYWIDTAAISFDAAQDRGIKAVKAAFQTAGIDLATRLYPVTAQSGQ